jgi:hypothetical protein
MTVANRQGDIGRLSLAAPPFGRQIGAAVSARKGVASQAGRHQRGRERHNGDSGAVSLAAPVPDVVEAGAQ